MAILDRAAKLLGIELDRQEDRVTRGESIASSYTASPYVAPEPSSAGWVNEHLPRPRDVKNYFVSLFPVFTWIHRYNLIWFYGDLVAGITVGAVVVPQSMAYARLAQLAPEFGLYSSFVGVLLYFPFATSKDITIGPVAVMSQIVGNIVLDAARTHPNIAKDVVASSLALLLGLIVLGVGLLRLGFIVDFIPLPAIAAFMTGSALNIAMGQIPTLFGLTSTDINTRLETYRVFIHFWKVIGRAKIDAALGLTALFLLYAIRAGCNFAAKKRPGQARAWFFVSTLRTAFVILLYTLVSFLVNRNHKARPKLNILKTVPRGFKHMRAPRLDSTIIDSYSNKIIVGFIVLLIEHIAISKSFGRVNGYAINPSQELIAIGITNIIGPFFGAYPATGSFSRTAIKAKAGVRTPLAGAITALVVLLAIYALTAVFFYIPLAALAAVIIHAVGDLITPPATLYAFWRVNPLEVGIFFAGVLVTVFSSIENGIYTTIIASLVLLLWRIAKPRGEFLGRATIRSVDGIDDTRNVFLPINHADGSNPGVRVESPYPGVFVYRFADALIYPNAFHYTNGVVEHILANTKRTNSQSYKRLGDRPWNIPGPRHVDPNAEANDPRPHLKAVILDLSGVAHLDVTSVSTLQDVRNQLNRWTQPEEVQFHFVGVRSPWSRRALRSAGFGKPYGDAKVIFSIAEPVTNREQTKISDDAEAANNFSRGVPITSTDVPNFHVDLTEALRVTLLSLGVDEKEVNSKAQLHAPARSYSDDRKDPELFDETKA